MKRTPLKRKTKICKTGKQPISKIQKLLWAECRRICYERYKNKDGSVDCYTCSAKNLEGSNRQLGHMLAKASLGAFLKYDLRLLRWQCARDNLWMGGMGAVFIENMRRIEGDKYVDQILKDRHVEVKAYPFYVELLEKYKKIKK